MRFSAFFDTTGFLWHAGVPGCLPGGDARVAGIDGSHVDAELEGAVGWYDAVVGLAVGQAVRDVDHPVVALGHVLQGCDIAQMDDFTVGLLCNHEVNLINQDILGKQADRTLKQGDIEVWTRPLSDGGTAIDIFNVGEQDQKVDMKALVPDVAKAHSVRDLWRQRDLSTAELSCTIPTHGCRYLKVTN